MMKLKELEYCLYCGEPTGKAGMGKDSLYVGTIGPLCEHCYDETGIAQLEAELETAKASGMQWLNELVDTQIEHDVLIEAMNEIIEWAKGCRQNRKGSHTKGRR